MVLWAISVSTGSADQVVNDDLIVQGNLCVGFDCVDGENFNADTVKLKENNLRISFIDTTAARAPTERWQVSANASNNGGDSYLAIETAIDTINPVISDGTLAGFDSAGTFYGCFPPLSLPCVPAGQALFDAAGNPVTQTVINTTNGLKVAAGADGGVAVGEGATTSPGTVSVGAPGSERRLVHVADGSDAHDAVTLGQMYSFDPLAEFNQQLDAVNSHFDGQVSAAEELEDSLEGAAAVAAALSALSPNARAIGRNHIGLGVGAYHSSVAIAAGYFRVVGPNAMVNLALSGSDDLHGAVSRVGFTYQW